MQEDHMGEAEEHVKRFREGMQYLTATQRRIAAANRDIKLALEEALAAHRCDGWAGCWCVRGRAALTRLQEA
jgi:hypothetical protein